MHLDDRHIIEIADIRNSNLNRIVYATRRAIARRSRRLWFRLLHHGLLRGRGCRTGGLQQQYHAAFGDAVSWFYAQFHDCASLWRWHVHRRLIGLECNQRLFYANGRPGSDMHLDDRHVFEVRRYPEP